LVGFGCRRDVLLTVQGIVVASEAGMVQALKLLETLKPGQDMQVTVLREGRIVTFTRHGPDSEAIYGVCSLPWSSAVSRPR
jgi:hypothetical protein